MVVLRVVEGKKHKRTLTQKCASLLFDCGFSPPPTLPLKLVKQSNKDWNRIRIIPRMDFLAYILERSDNDDGPNTGKLFICRLSLVVSWETKLFGNQNTGLPTDPDVQNKYQGPWLATQLTLSLGIGLASFLFFCFARRVERWKVLYSPRTLLKGFSPHEVHDKQGFFSWILPTLRTSEFTVLQVS